MLVLGAGDRVVVDGDVVSPGQQHGGAIGSPAGAPEGRRLIAAAVIVLLAIVPDAPTYDTAFCALKPSRGMGWSRGAARHVHGHRARGLEPALLIVLDRGVGDRDGAAAVAVGPDSPSRLARTNVRFWIWKM